MIKFVAAAIWIAAVTVGAVYFSFNMERSADGKPEAGFLAGLDYVAAPMISVPLLRDRQVQGYFLARLVYTVEPEKVKKLPVPVEALLTDQVYSYLYGNPHIDFTDRDGLDLEALRGGIRDAVNARAGEKLVHEVLIEQLEFLTREDIRGNSANRKQAALGAAGKLPPPEGGGH